jgi:transcriptional regulator with XRE-family HTH domain
VAGRRDIQTKIRTRLAYARISSNLSQGELAKLVGLPLATYRRLERGQLANPPIRYLTNIALVLNVDLEEICEDDWLWWTVFRRDQPADPPELRPNDYELSSRQYKLREADRAGKVPRSAKPRRRRSSS